MHFADFTLAIGERQPHGYAVSAVASELGSVQATLSLPPVALTGALTRAVSAQAPRKPAKAASGSSPGAGSAPAPTQDLLTKAGALLFDWAFPPTVRAQFCLAFDRAHRAGEGLRLRLRIEAAEIAAWPWELLHDEERNHTFATSASTPIVRFYDHSGRLGPLIEPGTDLPLELLLVLPATADLDLEQERCNVEQVAQATGGSLRVHTLDGAVTRADLADALLLGNYQILHFGGHGGFIEGRGYLGLNEPDGAPDWIDGDALGRLAQNYRSIRLALLNACASGQTDDGRAFAGIAPQLVRSGIAAVVAMQFLVTDLAAATFAREFYKRLCVGDEAGQVDVAVAYARSMLVVLHPGDTSWAAPVVYTNTPDGVIFTVPPRVRAGGPLDPLAQRERLVALTSSLQTSFQSEDDWKLADVQTLKMWRQMTERAGDAYRAHLKHPRLEVRQAAQQGLGLVEKRLAMLNAALARVTP